MSEVAELERRITAALERIEHGIGRFTPASGGDQAQLHEALESERIANAQLSAQVKTLGEKQQSLLRQLDLQGLELQRMKETNAQLLESLHALREASAANVTEPRLVNSAMVVELDALRAARLAEVVELEEILSELEPLIEEGEANA